MKKAILFGATGNLGSEIARELVKQDYEVTVVVRNKQKAMALLADLPVHYAVAEVSKKESLAGVCKGQDIVVSALGKSVSPNDKSKATFNEIDYEGNSAVLDEALKSGVKKFVYVSAFRS
jgi:nucleoside-diphosphate-sugar epimerase